MLSHEHDEWKLDVDNSHPDKIPDSNTGKLHFNIVIEIVLAKTKTIHYSQHMMGHSYRQLQSVNIIQNAFGIV